MYYDLLRFNVSYHPLSSSGIYQPFGHLPLLTIVLSFHLFVGQGANSLAIRFKPFQVTRSTTLLNPNPTIVTHI